MDSPLTPQQLERLRERRSTYPIDGIVRRMLATIDSQSAALDRIANSIRAWESDTVADELTRLGYPSLPDDA
jgi:hypothetical protein